MTAPPDPQELLNQQEEYRPTSRRQRLVILLVAVATAVTVWLAVLDPQGRLERLNRPPPDRAPCAAGQLADCAGGKLDVIVVPPSTPASSPP